MAILLKRASETHAGTLKRASDIYIIIYICRREREREKEREVSVPSFWQLQNVDFKVRDAVLRGERMVSVGDLLVKSVRHPKRKARVQRKERRR
jgi:hypothetical protein